MNPQIIPTLFALDKQTFNNKLKILEFTDNIHLDFMDGIFVPQRSVSLDDMEKVKTSDKEFEIHLMAKNPTQYLKKIESLGISKVLIQEEVFQSKEEIEQSIRAFKDADFDLFIVLNPNTSIERIKSLLEIIDGIMIMSVWPGKEGQHFIEETYKKINEIREFIGEGFPIQIDGGIKDLNAKKLIDSGANILSVGSFITSSNSPEKNYEKLLDLINS